MKNKIRISKQIKIIKEDLENLKIELLLMNSALKLKIEALYGDNITSKLFRKQSPVSDLLLLKYDDMWLSQLITIDERTFLIKYNKNFSIIFKDLTKRDRVLRARYDELIKSGCKETRLKEILTYLFSKYNSFFEEKFVPKNKDKEEYLADVIQVISSAEA